MANKENNQIVKPVMTRKNNSKDEDFPSDAKLVIEHEHPIAQAINKFLHRARDIKSAAKIHIPLSLKRRKQKFTEVGKIFEETSTLIKEKNKASQILRITKTVDAFRKLERLIQSDVPEILEISLFLGLFSSYDAFTGDLLKALYSKKPELFNKVNRSVPLSEILKFDSFDEMKDSILLNEIENFRRNSYVEQFENLEKDFEITLRKFERWSQFVECGQRRNLITHNDGIINEQYIKICSKEGYIFTKPVSLGDKLELNPLYFIESCELMMEVAFKLGQTLWRKLLPEEISEADDHSTEVIYGDCLQTESWNMAIVFADFIIKQKDLSSDQNRKINTINLAIALKFSGKKEEACKILSSIDWSSSSADFKLAENVLTDKFDDASEIMERIGKKGELISEESYHHFPLFKEFRKSEQFSKTYEKIFGYPFAVQVKRNADKKQVIAAKEIEKQIKEEKSLQEATEKDIKTESMPKNSNNANNDSKPSRGRKILKIVK